MSAATIEPPVEKSAPTTPSDISLINAQIKEDGMIRKIKPLWGSYYRVNFHNPENKNKIVASYFVYIANGKVIAEKESPIKIKE